MNIKIFFQRTDLSFQTFLSYKSLIFLRLFIVKITTKKLKKTSFVRFFFISSKILLEFFIFINELSVYPVFSGFFIVEAIENRFSGSLSFIFPRFSSYSLFKNNVFFSYYFVNCLIFTSKSW